MRSRISGKLTSSVMYYTTLQVLALYTTCEVQSELRGKSHQETPPQPRGERKRKMVGGERRS